MLRKGLGFHFEPNIVPASPHPPAIVLEDIKAHTEAYKNSNTPRGSYVPPPHEVVVAIEMARAAERHRRTPNRPTPTPPPIRATSSSSLSSSNQAPTTTSGYLKPPINSRTSSNGYSMGSSLPSGVSWRYVDVLNQDK